MGNSCSSGQGHKDKDNMSQRSEESSSYQVTIKKPSLATEKQQALINNVLAESRPPPPQHSGVILEPTTAGQVLSTSTAGERKAGLSRVLKEVATSSISADSMSLSSPPGTQSPRDFDRLYEASGLTPPPVPSHVQRLPDNLQQLLMGRVTTARTHTKTNKIVIYVSAADSQDCCVEKGALHNVLYPELRMYCRDKGYELHIVDLHWKTVLELQQDHEFPELCLGELTRQMEVAYIIPVLFLNNSLGTPLLPGTIESADFQTAMETVLRSDPEAEALLAQWYQLDSAAQPPCYRLQAMSRGADARQQVERLLAVLVAVLPVELRDTYLTTVVEQEVHNTVFMSQEMAKRCVWISRGTPGDGKAESPVATEMHRRLTNLQQDLKSQLNEKHILRLPVPAADRSGYVTQVCALLRPQLRDLVDAIVDEHQARVRLKPAQGISAQLFQELNQQTNYCQRAAQCSVNREQVLNEIKKYITSDVTSPLVIYGPAGCGKSTLIARIAQCCQQWLPEAFLILRFVGISAQSNTIEQLLNSIVNQCTILTCGHICYCAHNLETYVQMLPAVLDAGCLQRPLIILVDGLDQAKCADAMRRTDWVLDPLPSHVKLIVTVAEGHGVHRALLRRLTGRPACFVQMPLLGEAEARGILMASVMEYNHSVNAKVQDCVLKSVQECTLPLYAKVTLHLHHMPSRDAKLSVLAWQTSWWADKAHDVVPKGHVSQQLQQMLEELETILGSAQVQHALALLTNARYGLTDPEAIDLLALDAEFHSSQTYVLWAPACLAWSRLTKHLAPFLRWTLAGDTLCAQWKDNLLRQTVASRYERHIPWAVQTLHDYYAGKWWTQKDERLTARLISQETLYTKCYNKRKLDELPFHCWQLDPKTFRSSQYLTDLNWIYEKICGSNSYELLEDIQLVDSDANEDVTDGLLGTLKAFVEFYSTTLNYDGRQFYSHLNFYLETRLAQGILFSDRLKSVLEATRNPPVASFLVTNIGDVQIPQLRRTEQPPFVKGTRTFDLVTRFAETDRFVVSVSTEKEEICVWDVHKCQRIRTLRNVPHPSNLIPINKHCCVVLCRRELRVYDLDAGAFIARVKGVMNQKMPYYGLHDAAHLVALSRNRMCVHLMNVETGDCAATFKAGEDRFLNSLLVSGDGRVLVCGDETQKPFPLLVWNLKSRKLMYDLRIPHHDFVTSLAAITYEGNYVCCVCHELDEPAPNFIVVYDLQSGTLFKKWKPSCDTVSLEISSPSGCVISGLEDARILVWDLITGNCRWSLPGHTAPVTLLRLDATGRFSLSTDTLCRDRSIRLWDIDKGQLVAVYTPDANVSACEITSAGRCLVLALEQHENLVCLELHPQRTETEPEEYGRPDNNGRVFDLNDASSTDPAGTKC